MEVKEGFVAENDKMGTWAFCPKSIMNLAWLDFCGPRIACTCTFFIRSTAEHQRNFHGNFSMCVNIYLHVYIYIYIGYINIVFFNPRKWCKGHDTTLIVLMWR